MISCGFEMKSKWNLPSWHTIQKQNANMPGPLWSEIWALAGAKCQPAQTDGVKRLTLVRDWLEVEWQRNTGIRCLFSVDVVNIKRAECCCQDGEVKSRQGCLLCFAGAFRLCGMLSSCHHDRKMLGLDEQHRNVFDISMDKQDIYISF